MGSPTLREQDGPWPPLGPASLRGARTIATLNHMKSSIVPNSPLPSCSAQGFM